MPHVARPPYYAANQHRAAANSVRALEHFLKQQHQQEHNHQTTHANNNNVSNNNSVRYSMLHHAHQQQQVAQNMPTMLPFTAAGGYPFPQHLVELAASVNPLTPYSTTTTTSHGYCDSFAVAAAAAAAAASRPTATHLGKSFTIEAILGLERDFSSKITDSHADITSGYGPVKDCDIRRKNRLNAVSGSPYTTFHTAPTSHLVNKHSHHQVSDKEVRPDESDGSVSSGKAPKSKRVRTIFTPEQLERLEGEFERQQYMVGPERLYLASALNLTEAQVKVWFQNRRIKWRKQHLEMQQARLAKIRGDSDPQREEEESDDSTDEENE